MYKNAGVTEPNVEDLWLTEWPVKLYKHHVAMQTKRNPVYMSQQKRTDEPPPPGAWLDWVPSVPVQRNKTKKKTQSIKISQNR